MDTFRVDRFRNLKPKEVVIINMYIIKDEKKYF